MLFAVISLFAVSAVCQTGSLSLTDVLAHNNNTLSSLSGLLKTQPDLVDTLSKLKDITILAPTNDAISKLDSDAMDKVASDSDFLKSLLEYHVLNGTIKAAHITSKPTFAHTLLKNEKFANVSNGQVVEALTDGESVKIKSAFGAESTVTKADIAFKGGVIHLIDTVLTIPQSVSTTATEANLTALAGALTQANLIPTLEGLKDITVFAPSNDAFGAISSITGGLSTEDLSKILQYHVIQGTVAYSSSLSNTSVETLEKQDVRITVQNGQVFANAARVIVPDVLIGNGVVHVIDGVLNPDNANVKPNPSTTVPAFSGASSVSSDNVPFTSGAGGAGGTAITTQPSTQGSVPQATAAVLAGVLFGGAALAMNGL